MRRRIDRPPKPIVVLGAYALLVPQLALLAVFLFVTAGNVVAPGDKYRVGDSVIVPLSQGTAHECVKFVLIAGLIWLYSAILWKVTNGWMRSRRQRRALRNNLCLSCGYDTRASPERCPECGEIIRS